LLIPVEDYVDVEASYREAESRETGFGNAGYAEADSTEAGNPTSFTTSASKKLADPSQR